MTSLTHPVCFENPLCCVINYSMLYFIKVCCVYVGKTHRFNIKNFSILCRKISFGDEQEIHKNIASSCTVFKDTKETSSKVCFHIIFSFLLHVTKTIKNV